MDESFSSNSKGPKYNTAAGYSQKYQAFLQNKEFSEYLAKNFDGSMGRIVEAIEGFKVEFPHIELPEIDMGPLEEGIAKLTAIVEQQLIEQQSTNDYLKMIIELLQRKI